MALVIHMKVQISDLSLFNYLMMNTLKFQWFKWQKVYDRDNSEAIHWIASRKKAYALETQTLKYGAARLQENQ